MVPLGSFVFLFFSLPCVALLPHSSLHFPLSFTLVLHSSPNLSISHFMQSSYCNLGLLHLLFHSTFWASALSLYSFSCPHMWQAHFNLLLTNFLKVLFVKLSLRQQELESLTWNQLQVWLQISKQNIVNVTFHLQGQLWPYLGRSSQPSMAVIFSRQTAPMGSLPNFYGEKKQSCSFRNKIMMCTLNAPM